MKVPTFFITFFLATECFGYMRQVQERGPLVNSEFYVGWIAYWNESRPHIQAKAIERMLKHLLSVNASFNFYVFNGGTNFGFTSGATTVGNTLETAGYRPTLTTYDFSAPLNEFGDPTENYYVIKRILGGTVIFSYSV